MKKNVLFLTIVLTMLVNLGFAQTALDAVKTRLAEKFTICISYYSSSSFDCGSTAKASYYDMSVSDATTSGTTITVTGQFTALCPSGTKKPFDYTAILTKILDDYEVTSIKYDWDSKGTCNYKLFPLSKH